MTKAEITSEIAKTTGIDKAAVVTVIERFMNVVKDSGKDSTQHQQEHTHSSLFTTFRHSNH